MPKLRTNLTRHRCVLAPNRRCRGVVRPAKRGKYLTSIAGAKVRSPTERHIFMTSAQWLKRSSNTDIEIFDRYSEAAKVIAYIEEQAIINKMRAHLREKVQPPPPSAAAATITRPL